MNHPVILVALGGAFGSICRYYAATAVRNWIGPTKFPWPVFLINVLGSLLIGWFASEGRDRNHPAWLLLAVGVCGGFTTFSAFSLDLFEEVEKGRLGEAFLYAAGSVLLGLAAFALGIWIGRAVKG